MAARNNLTQERLRELLHYDEVTGHFTWLAASGPRAKVGARAGTAIGGYRAIGVDKVVYKEHRLAWLYVKGVWPALIDHKNREPSDNSWLNLREASQSQNMQNTVRKKGLSGFRGVYWNTTDKNWHARISIDGKRVFLGGFDCALVASAVYEIARNKHHTHRAVEASSEQQQ